MIKWKFYLQFFVSQIVSCILQELQDFWSIIGWSLPLIVFQQILIDFVINIRYIIFILFVFNILFILFAVIDERVAEVILIFASRFVICFWRAPSFCCYSKRKKYLIFVKGTTNLIKNGEPVLRGFFVTGPSVDGGWVCLKSLLCCGFCL